MPEPLLKDSEFQQFSKFVYDTCGINLHEGKKELVKARIGKILRQRNFPSFRAYYDYVVHDKSGNELPLLLDAVSTNLTYFFRESQHFDFLRKKALPEIVKRKMSSRNSTISLWSAGCSSGEEAYSVAMTISEILRQEEKWQVKILATDISTKVLESASTGIYEEKKIDSIPYELKRRYFQKGGNTWAGYFRVKQELRKNITFQRLNLGEEFQFTVPFDVIFCRNVMIYFDKATRETLVGKLFRNLCDGGYLFIGHAESLSGIKHHLKYMQPSIYRKI